MQHFSVIMKVQIKTTLRFYFTPVKKEKKAIIKKIQNIPPELSATKNNICPEKGAFSHS